jgi:hypothetical protein
MCNAAGFAEVVRDEQTPKLRADVTCVNRGVTCVILHTLVLEWPGTIIHWSQILYLWAERRNLVISDIILPKMSEDLQVIAFSNIGFVFCSTQT